MHSFIQTNISLVKGYLPLFLTVFLWSSIIIGIIARIALYVINPTLWLDESALTLNILDFKFHELLRTDRFSQSAPFAYLLVEKLLTSFVGIQEYVLRLPAFIAGLAAIFLLYRLFEAFEIKNKVMLAFYAVLPVAITYSVQQKQYMIELAISALLLTLTREFLSSHDKRKLLKLLIAGVISLFFSQTSIFILAACGLTLAYDQFFTQKVKIFDLVKKLLPIAAAWGISFLALYFIQYRYTSGNEHLHAYWENSKAFLRLNDFETFNQLYLSIFSFIYSFGKIAPLLLLIGLLGAYGINIFAAKEFYTKNKVSLLLVLLTLAFSILASLLGFYPLQGRLTIFLIPSTLLLFGILLHNSSYLLVKSGVTLFIAALTVLLTVTLRYFPQRYVIVGYTYGFQENLKEVMLLQPSEYSIYFIDGNPTMEYYLRRYPKLREFKVYSFDNNSDWKTDISQKMTESKLVFLFPYKLSEWQEQIDYIASKPNVTCETSEHFMCISD